jgi:hypothetical protein
LVVFEFVRAFWAVLVVLGGPAYALLQFWTLRRLEEGWRYAALLPLLFALALIGAALDGGFGAPSISALLTAALAGAFYLAALVGLSWLVHRVTAHPPTLIEG